MAMFFHGFEPAPRCFRPGILLSSPFDPVKSNGNFLALFRHFDSFVRS